MLTVHDWISGRAARIRMLEKMLDVVTTTPGIWIATVGEVAAHHAAQGQCRPLLRAAADAGGERVAPLHGARVADADLHGPHARGSLAARPRRRPEPPCGRSRRGCAGARRQRDGRGDRHRAGAERGRALALGRRRRRLPGPCRWRDRRGRDARFQCASPRRRSIPTDYPLADAARRQLVQLAGCRRRPQCLRLQLDLRAGRDRGLRGGAREATAPSPSPRRCSRRSSMPSAGWRSTGTRRSASRSRPTALAHVSRPRGALLLDDGRAPKRGAERARAIKPMPRKAETAASGWRRPARAISMRARVAAHDRRPICEAGGSTIRARDLAELRSRAGSRR